MVENETESVFFAVRSDAASRYPEKSGVHRILLNI